MTEFNHPPAGESGDDGDGIERYGKSFAELGKELIRKRDFLGRMVTREYMEQLGLTQIGDDQNQAWLTDTLHKYVVSGMLLKAGENDDPDSVETTVALLREGVPAILQDSIGLLIPLFVERGIEFQTSERGSKKEQAWLQEYTLLHEATSE